MEKPDRKGRNYSVVWFAEDKEEVIARTGYDALPLAECLRDDVRSGRYGSGKWFYIPQDAKFMGV